MGRFQFSIRFLLVATVAVAAGTVATIAEPSPSSNLAIDFLTLLFAAAAMLGVAQTTGRLRAFWIGTAAALGPVAVIAAESGMFVWMYLGENNRFVDFSEAHLVWPLWCAAPVVGLFTVFFHWLFCPPTQEAGGASDNQISK